MKGFPAVDEQALLQYRAQSVRGTDGLGYDPGEMWAGQNMDPYGQQQGGNTYALYTEEEWMKGFPAVDEQALLQYRAQSVRGTDGLGHDPGEMGQNMAPHGQHYSSGDGVPEWGAGTNPVDRSYMDQMQNPQFAAPAGHQQTPPMEDYTSAFSQQGLGAAAGQHSGSSHYEAPPPGRRSPTPPPGAGRVNAL